MQLSRLRHGVKVTPVVEQRVSNRFTGGDFPLDQAVVFIHAVDIAVGRRDRQAIRRDLHGMSVDGTSCSYHVQNFWFRSIRDVKSSTTGRPTDGRIRCRDRCGNATVRLIMPGGLSQRKLARFRKTCILFWQVMSFDSSIDGRSKNHFAGQDRTPCRVLLQSSLPDLFACEPFQQVKRGTIDDGNIAIVGCGGQRLVFGVADKNRPLGATVFGVNCLNRPRVGSYIERAARHSFFLDFDLIAPGF